MKQLWLSLFSLLMVATQGPLTTRSEVVLEVQKESAGMASQPGKHLYLRVIGNGQCQYDYVAVTGGTVRFKKRVSNEQVQGLLTLLSQPGVRALAQRYEGAPTIDSVETITFLILRGQQKQSIRVINFCPGCDEIKYPTALVDLMCAVKAIRTGRDISKARLDPDRCAFWTTKGT